MGTHDSRAPPATRLADPFIAEQVGDLWEPWMRHANQALNDDRLLEIVQAAWSKLCKKSKTRGRTGTPAEIILRPQPAVFALQTAPFAAAGACGARGFDCPDTPGNGILSEKAE